MGVYLQTILDIAFLTNASPIQLGINFFKQNISWMVGLLLEIFSILCASPPLPLANHLSLATSAIHMHHQNMHT